MKILLAHNFYKFAGGEDRVFHTEADMLEAHGHKVIRYIRDNQSIDGMDRLSLARKTLWNADTIREVKSLIGHERPDIVHCHNTFPLISPTIYYAAIQCGVPTIQTLHNYRIICPQSYLLRDDAFCTACVGRSLPFAAIRHRCYRNSVAATATLAAMIARHWLQNTWTRKVSQYIALSAFAKKMFVRGGLPENRIHIKPNSVPDPGPLEGATNERGGALFVGRLSPEKGIRTLLDAWRNLDMPLDIYGEGPMAKDVHAVANPVIRYHGQQSQARIRDAMRRAALLVLPSIWPEGFPMVVLEAFANGLPVIGSEIGSLQEIIRSDITGQLYPPGDPAALAATVRQAIDQPGQLAAMGANAREEYMQKFAPNRNYAALLSIYRDALAGQNKKVQHTFRKI